MRAVRLVKSREEEDPTKQKAQLQVPLRAEIRTHGTARWQLQVPPPRDSTALSLVRILLPEKPSGVLQSVTQMRKLRPRDGLS